MICSKCSVDISETQEYADLVVRMNKAIDFLSRHPALGGFIFDLHHHLWYSAQEVCKRGYSRLHDGKIELFCSKENYKRYKDLFDGEFKKEPISKYNPRALVRIDIPYETHYGEPWKFDHIEYWGEMSFTMFIGKNFKKYHDRTKWMTYSGIETSGRSFEELIINVEKEFKKRFGDFTEEDFLTKKEIENHKKEFPFFFVKTKKFPGCSRMKHNRKHIDVTEAEINRRWVKWFAKTPYAKKNWASSCKEILLGKEIIS